MVATSSLSRALALTLVALLFAACSTDSNPTLPLEYGDLLFPRQKAVDGERDVMEALVYGTLEVSEECLHLNDREASTVYVPIWPPDYSLDVTASPPWVLDGAGRSLVTVGQEVLLSGGEIHTLTGISGIDASVKEALITRCPGPYWIVGDTVQPVSE